jgi:serine/threonine protein kinase
MELLGKNVANLKKSMGETFTNIFVYDILLQMLTCIENVHSKGYIHRDIKPSNFVICPKEKKVYIIDFGLAKLHLNRQGESYPERKNADFRGTIAYASMNAHNKLVLNF